MYAPDLLFYGLILNLTCTYKAVAFLRRCIASNRDALASGQSTEAGRAPAPPCTDVAPKTQH